MDDLPRRKPRLKKTMATFYIPDEIRQRMRAFTDVIWSQYVARKLSEACDELEKNEKEKQ